jgi:O-antigen/teichoic acid export membrane protein
MGLKELDVLLVGGVLGHAAAGLYKVVKQCSNICHDLIGPLHDALYPELNRAWARREERTLAALMARASLAAGGATASIWAGFALLGRPFLELVFGAAYVGAHPALVWYLLAVTAAAAAMPLGATLLTMGRPDAVMWTNALSAGLYLPALVWLLRTVGLPGAGIAYLGYYGVWSLSLAARVWAGWPRGRWTRAAAPALIPAAEVGG